MYQEKLDARKLPELFNLENDNLPYNKELWQKRRLEILEMLSREMYGFSPAPPNKVNAFVKKYDGKAFAGKAVHTKLDIIFDTPAGEFSFPIDLIIPNSSTPVPLFLNISFYSEIPNMYYPAEEIIDGGFATASFNYQDVVADTSDEFKTGLAGMYEKEKRTKESWGKLAMWAWAASRVMDYIQTCEEIDKQRIAVIGHSRLGKAALWCAAQDERFEIAIANNSGCSGAALARGNKGESVFDITKNFSYWFCENYIKYSDNENSMPFDQHFLLAAIAPRKICIASAEEDIWADWESEFLSCLAASPEYELFGLSGLVTEDKRPQPGTMLPGGAIKYHLRNGTHFLSRYDWQQFMERMKNI